MLDLILSDLNNLSVNKSANLLVPCDNYYHPLRAADRYTCVFPVR